MTNKQRFARILTTRDRILDDLRRTRNIKEFPRRVDVPGWVRSGKK